MPENYAIELKGITKTFGSVVANDSINLNVKNGEILALLGENGSGKTTLMNMLSGIYRPDAGKIFISGDEVSINSPEDAQRYRIGMVHQHFKLIDKFTAADNIWISSNEEHSVMLSDKRYKKIGSICEKFGFDIDLRKKICDMAVSEKQTVEIIKVLYNGADILILDEPTAVLTLQETRKLFDVLRRMRDSGHAIVIITHKLNEVLELSDRVTILRKGKSEATVCTSETDAHELTELMVGHSVELSIDKPEVKCGDVYLNVQNLSIKNEEGVLAVNDVSFELHGGEILGIAGVSGCGQKELCEAIAGLQNIESGSIIFKGKHIEGQSPRSIIEHGISMSFIPEDRLGMGLAATLDITDNMLLKNYRKSKGIFVDRKSAKKDALEVIDEFQIATPNAETPVRLLSGGNVQKVLLGREIKASPEVLITAYPVRGLDINSSYTIFNILNEQKQKNVAVLYVGEDLDVMLELCDRIMVLCHGKLTGIVDAGKTSKEELGLMMTDAHSGIVISEKAGAERDNSGSGADLTKSSDKKSGTSNKKHMKAPFRLVARSEVSTKAKALLYCASVLVALFLGALFVAVNGTNPLLYYKEVFVSCFKNAISIRSYIWLITPLIITSLGVSVSFKMRFWNVGANGQFIMGAIAGAFTALLAGESLPRWLTLILMAAAGIIGGALIGFIPAYFKVRFGASETLLTLMFNYIAYYFLTYLKNVLFFRKVSETGQLFRPDFKAIPQNGWLYDMKIGGVTIDISFFIAIILVFVIAVYFNKSKQGYEISVIGDSPATARYAGMSVTGIIIRTMLISSAIAGLAGMLKLASSSTLHTLGDNITSDVGWTGVIVAWLSKLNPYAILIVSALMGILQRGTEMAQNTMNLSSALSDIMQGIILFTVLALDFFIRFKVVFETGKESE